MLPALYYRASHLRTGAVSVLTLALVVLGSLSAHAQQTFLCEDGGSVTVLPGQLELMKRTDPCVARHFQEPQDPMSNLIEETATAPPSGFAPMEAPLPEKKPGTLMADAGAAGESLDPMAAQPEPAAEVESDYRHVHIINARPGEPKFFEHSR